MTAASVIPNLWPDDIRVSALPPVVLLKAQAEGLRERTKGVLDADVTTTTGAEDFETHTLYVIAKQLGRSRHGVLSVTHRAEVYPVLVEAKVFEPSEVPSNHFQTHAAAHAAALQMATGTMPRPWPDPEGWRPIAASQEQLLELLSKVLRSMPVRSLVESLLARSYEKKLAVEAAQPAA